MVPEAGLPPVAQQVQRESVAIRVRFEIAVMDEDGEGVGDLPRGVLHKPGMPVFELTVCLRSKDALNGRFGQDLHCDPVAVCVTQAIPQSRFVVREVVLSRWSEEFGTVHFRNVVQHDPVSVVHPDVVPQTGKEGLHVLRDANAEVLVDRPCYSIVSG